MLKSPLVYLSNPPIIFRSVVFPHPLGPKIDTNSDFLNSTFIPFNASTLLSPDKYVFVIFFKFSIISSLKIYNINLVILNFSFFINLLCIIFL